MNWKASAKTKKWCVKPALLFENWLQPLNVLYWRPLLIHGSVHVVVSVFGVYLSSPHLLFCASNFNDLHQNMIRFFILIAIMNACFLKFTCFSYSFNNLHAYHISFINENRTSVCFSILNLINRYFSSGIALWYQKRPTQHWFTRTWCCCICLLGIWSGIQLLRYEGYSRAARPTSFNSCLLWPRGEYFFPCHQQELCFSLIECSSIILSVLIICLFTSMYS